MGGAERRSEMRLTLYGSSPPPAPRLPFPRHGRLRGGWKWGRSDTPAPQTARLAWAAGSGACEALSQALKDPLGSDGG